MSKLVAVFGSARLEAHDPLYEATRTLGAALGQQGHTVITGGYDGVMGAASQGAAEAGGTVVGVTVTALELQYERTPNRWLTQEIRYATMRERLHHLVIHPDAYIIMPGGVGTLQEIAEVWQMFRLSEIPHRPFMLYGRFWHPMFETMLQSGYVSAKDWESVYTVDSAEDVISVLAHWKSETALTPNLS
ncbi:TIGR00730 family Rossman fold protein [bacterium]|nr:TIGR00730 family Rossman fold protein [bacterium]